MRTKEKIIGEYGHITTGNVPVGVPRTVKFYSYRDVLDMMGEYGKELGIGLADFCNDNYLYKENGRWMKSEDKEWGSKTDDQLLHLYLKSKQ